ncbi:putative S-adenosylmethionine-dependent [Encephalitozoon romaleae SJ-2008]|uniref:tRNA (guanine-N(7)-)-methyltransferase n=1 Tax=Encephalitozoon romaleae (strain SJ-2008) TaxID=1178016 RepID=I7AUG3_ENCRO|nr:putative S-adenosylmethionine-dependent [Encephalitozoon romaleae SJ-2008]AFN84122.1 putative S-adenosylmethionine-dependent [Encephalitozoon romaleae SJ-2008]
MQLKNIKKGLYRQRAHANPFKDSNIVIPPNPQSVDWASYFEINRRPDFVDIGCGYGKFLMKVAEKNPGRNVLGLEIRDKVCAYVRANIENLRIPNAGVMRTNALIFLPNIFSGGQLSKIFILFPDPHFKKRKQKGRIVCQQMMEVYEYLLRNEGRLYISTDVEDLFDYMVDVILAHKGFEPLSEEEMNKDPLFYMISKDTDEALRAGVKTGKVFSKVFEIKKD